MGPIYDRIAKLIQPGAKIADLGGGCGDLAAMLQEKGADATVYDHSAAGLKIAKARGLKACRVDLRLPLPLDGHYDGFVSTEVLEHLDEPSRSQILDTICDKPAMLAVPNNCMGPDTEAQHTIKWTAKEFLDYLRGWWKDVRVEVFGHRMLAVCGVPKPQTVSVCFPARDEEHDIERVLASFRGVADQLVVGIDPRSADRTEEIARQYADVVFTIEEPDRGVDGENNVHFSHIRNQCIARCTGDWIFMTEAHESLQAGVDDVLALGSLEDWVRVVLVVRRGLGSKYKFEDGEVAGLGFVQRWMFPWVWRRKYGYQFERAKHNYLNFPDEVIVKHLMWLPQIVTYHDRDERNACQRKVQRTAHNRRDLFDDWQKNGTSNSLYYLASEWRGIDSERAIHYFEKMLALPSDNGPRRYQARLILAKEYVTARDDLKAAKECLMDCPKEDWSRIDHWVYLGDLAMSRERWEEAIQMYILAASRWRDMPLSVWWIDEAFYTWLPCERLAMCYASIGELEKALGWATKARASLPVETPDEVVAIHDSNIKRIEEKINGSARATEAN